MSNFKTRALMGVSALAAASALAAGAQATTVLNGDGSSLVAPALAQLTGCWDNVVSPATPLAPNGQYYNKAANGQNTLTTPPATSPSCSNNTPGAPASFVYVSTGSGVGQVTLFAHNGGITQIGATVPLSGLDPISGLAEYGAAQYAFSDNAMADADIGVYNFGTGVSYTPPNSRPVVTTAATYQGLQFGAGATAIPAPLYGALVQFPVTIDPVDLAYNSSGLTGLSGTLVLDRDAYCKIFTGGITDWSSSELATLNGLSGSGSDTLTGTAANGSAHPIEVVVRSDSSGTSSIFTRHLARVCDGVLGGTANNPYKAGVTTFPAALTTGIPDQVAESGSGGVAGEIHNTAGAIGYLGNDYVSTAANTFSLPAAQLFNDTAVTMDSSPIAPSSSAALTAFGGVSLPSDVTDAFQWAQSPDKTVELADPSTPGSYPIVGSSQFLGYTCYATVDTVNSLRDFFNYLYGANGQAIITADGLAPLPSSWTDLIKTTFLDPEAFGDVSTALADVTGNTGDDAGDTNSTCTGLTGG